MRARILIVDPDPDTRLLYRIALSDVAAEYVDAEDGAEALGRALSRPPDLVVADQRLPRVSGYELCAILRDDFLTSTAATILVSGGPEFRRSRDGDSRSPDAVLPKPCDPEVLAATARGLLKCRERGDTPADSSAPAEPSKRRVMSHDHVRWTTSTPPTAAPHLHCPRCDFVLEYQRTEIGGVNDRFTERWDYLSCARCGVFQYRHRTRKLRLMVPM